VDFEVAERRLATRTPIDQAQSAIDEPLAIELDEGFGHRAREPWIEREALAAPVARGTQAAQLVEDSVAVGLAPLPYACDERLAANVVTVLTLFRELAFDHVLRGDSG